MRRRLADGRPGFWSIFQEHQPADERARLFAKRTFPVRRPEVMRRADSLLGTIIGIVPKGRAGLAFELQGCNQAPLVHHQ